METVSEGFVLASVIVVGTVGLWPASTAMLTRLVRPNARQNVYGLNFMLLNAGLGIGGVVSSLIIDTDSVASFQRLYLLDGATYVVYIAVLLTLPRGTGAPAEDDEDRAPTPSASRPGRSSCATAPCSGSSGSRSWRSRSGTPRWRRASRRTPWRSPRCPRARWAGRTPPTPVRSCSASWSRCA